LAKGTPLRISENKSYVLRGKRKNSGDKLSRATRVRLVLSFKGKEGGGGGGKAMKHIAGELIGRDNSNRPYHKCEDRITCRAKKKRSH